MAPINTYYRKWEKAKFKSKISQPSDEVFIAMLLTDDPKTRHVFQGVYAVNEIIKKPTKFPCAFIYNILPRASPMAGHWICIYLFHNKHKKLCAEFFGSFGLKPPERLLNMVRKWTPRINWNKKWFQNYNSSVCGMYSVYFLHYRCRGWSMAKIQKHFDSRTKINDTLVKDSILATVEYS